MGIHLAPIGVSHGNGRTAAYGDPDKRREQAQPIPCPERQYEDRSGLGMQQYRGRMDDTSANPWKGLSEFIPNTLDNLRVRSQSRVWVFHFFRRDNRRQRIWAARTGQVGQNHPILWDVYVHVPVVSHSACPAAPLRQLVPSARLPTSSERSVAGPNSPKAAPRGPPPGPRPRPPPGPAASRAVPGPHRRC